VKTRFGGVIINYMCSPHRHQSAKCPFDPVLKAFSHAEYCICHTYSIFEIYEMISRRHRTLILALIVPETVKVGGARTCFLFYFIPPLQFYNTWESLSYSGEGQHCPCPAAVGQSHFCTCTGVGVHIDIRDFRTGYTS